MKLIDDVKVIATDSFIELMALKTEADGMISENRWREVKGESPAYTETDFAKIAFEMRLLKIDRK